VIEDDESDEGVDGAVESMLLTVIDTFEEVLVFPARSRATAVSI
jgi:hypothetical protein